jgi:hypothetical protein
MRAKTKVRDIEETVTKVRTVALDHLENTAVVVEGHFRFFRVRPR